MSQTTLTGDLQAGTGENNTPLKWVRPIATRLGGFSLDPCASDDSVLAETNIRNSGGLAVNWSEHRTVWCNHPYARNEPGKWLQKAAECNAETVVTLSKGDPSTDWFQQYLTRADLLCFPSERIKFVGHENGAKWGNVYGVFGSYPRELLAWFQSKGWVVKPGTEPVAEEVGRP